MASFLFFIFYVLFVPCIHLHENADMTRLADANASRFRFTHQLKNIPKKKFEKMALLLNLVVMSRAYIIHGDP